MVDETQEIVDAIRLAFRGVQRGEITIHEAEVIDNYGGLEERAAARRADAEGSWEEIPDDHVEECANALPHLDPQSWCYYLPRYMEWTLRHRASSRSIAVDHTIYALRLGDDRSLNDHLRARYNELTSEQSKVVGAFLAFMMRDPDHCDAGAASDALSKFWQKFLDH